MNAFQSVRIHAAAGLAAIAVSAAARAQEFNIDVGATAGTNPAAAYGGAAGQPGFWNWVSADAVGVFQGLSPLGGGAPIAAVEVNGGNGNYAFDNPATLGNDGLFMDDVQDVGGVGAVATYEFVGLPAGPYWIYTYAWAPDDPDYRTKIEVAGSPDPAQLIGGAWPGGHEYQVTFARHFAFHPGGAAVLTVTATTIAGFGSVNGFQLSTGPCEAPVIYGESEPNTDGCVPSVFSAGEPSLADAAAGVPFWIGADDVLSGVSGIVFYSRLGPAAAPFTDWTRYVAAPVVRTPIVNAGGAGACGGTLGFDFNAHIQDQNTAAPGTFVASDPIWAQWWSRDPADAPANTNLTQAIHFTVCP